LRGVEDKLVAWVPVLEADGLGFMGVPFPQRVYVVSSEGIPDFHLPVIAGGDKDLQAIDLFEPEVSDLFNVR